MIVYFSGTGNSRYCAKMASDLRRDSVTDSFDFIRNEERANLESEKPWIFVCPTYSWQMPRVFEDFIEKTVFTGSREAYFILTCGGETGNASERVKELCDKKGFEFKGLLPVVMPDNYIVMFKAPTEEKSAEMIKKAEEKMKKGIELIKNGESFPAVKVNAADRLKSGIVNEGFYRFFIKAKGFRVKGACIGCGKCEEVCVLGNIKMKDGKPIWGDRCTQCMACISLCPQKAIEYGKRTAGKRRYVCPEYTGNQGCR